MITCPGRRFRKLVPVERFRPLNYSHGTALTLGALLCLGVQILFDLEHRAGAVYSLPIYAAVFVILLIFCHALSRAGRIRPLAAGLYHTLFVLHFAACFLFDAFYEDALHRRYSLLDADSDNVAYLIHSILPWSVLLSFVASLALAYGFAAVVHRSIRRPRVVSACLLILGSIGAAVADRPALHAFVASDVADYLSGTRPGIPTNGPHSIESYANLKDRSIALNGR